MKKLKTLFVQFRTKYWPLFKSLQTTLLLLTGVSGYLSARPEETSPVRLLSVVGSLFLAIGGSTVLNMWYDRDIDAIMKRTCTRPLAAQRISPEEALALGVILSGLGVGWSLWIAPLYGAVVFAGWFFDVIVYTIWLKRRTAWSIVWGGISGGMPVLAGRALAIGRIDLVGVTLTLAILFWIPTHILTFNMRYHQDYQAARIPTFVSVYGFHATRIIIAASSIMAALAMGLASYWVGTSTSGLRLLAVLGTGLLVLALSSTASASDRLNFSLFKYASIYMMGAMLLLVFG